MIARNKGSIVNIASIAGRETYPLGNVYCATKSAVRTLSEAMRIDVNGSGVRVMNVDPGMVETEFSIVRFSGDEQRAKQVYAGLHPLTAHDVAEVIVFSVNRPSHIMIGDILLLHKQIRQPFTENIEMSNAWLMPIILVLSNLFMTYA
jgi:NADP-dependent 3-hydroxy acid dehydrogenase YdfG